MSGDNMLNAELISHHILSHRCSWRLQLERCFSNAVVGKLMSSFMNQSNQNIVLAVAVCILLFWCCRLRLGESASHPISPFALKGECHKFSRMNEQYHIFEELEAIESSSQLSNDADSCSE